VQALQPFADHVSKETLARDLCFLQDNGDEEGFSKVEIGEHEAAVSVSRA
jgi:hypothetical protein